MEDKLLDQWRSFTQRKELDEGTLRPVTLQAWNRCREIGIEPERLEYRFLSDEELASRRSENASLIEAARPYLDHLSMALSDRPHAVALSDRDGWIIELRENPVNAFGGRTSGICLGSSWNERDIGNNGIGTALATGAPVLVYGIEHYATVYHPAHCLGVPIRAGGEIVGCLDVSVIRDEDADPAHLTIAQACVASIESTLGAWRSSEERQNEIGRFAALGKLLSTTVHDLKGPLTVIRGIAQLGHMTAVSDERRKYFSDIIAHADRLQEMIEQVQSEPTDDELVSVVPAAILDQVLHEFTPVCAMKGITVERQLDCDRQTAAVPPLLRRALYNIVSNALDAMPSGGRLTARARSEGESVVLAIADTGCGIPADVGERIFEPFVHGRENGTGLGLYMAREVIVGRHGGEIRFESPAGGGTTFEVTLPIRNVVRTP